MTDESQEAQAKSPVEVALDAFVYAPIGLIFEGSSLLPQLIEKGRNQVTMARMIGRFAVDQASTEAAKAAGKLGDQAAGLADLLGGAMAPGGSSGAQSAPSATARTSTDAGRAKTPPKAAPKAPGAARQAVRRVALAGEVGGADASGLAIPDYDGLSASHVVNRLAGLSRDELEAVRIYEQSNRGRKTILSKISQLQTP